MFPMFYAHVRDKRIAHAHITLTTFNQITRNRNSSIVSRLALYGSTTHVAAQLAPLLLHQIIL